MDGDGTRSAVVVAGVLFWLGFTAMTLYVIAVAGLTLLSLAAVALIVVTGVPLLSSLLRDSPKRR